MFFLCLEPNIVNFSGKSLPEITLICHQSIH
uniref:Uncharacterized protein n=1 Tax=Arundo donax TaxID=35708 RepID=A0A0A9EZ77_ARUDO